MQDMFHEAQHWHELAPGRVKCTLCRIGCVVSEGEYGVCGVRTVKGGRLYTTVYGRAAAVSVDPVEKKPLYHVAPGSRAFSFATVGCNFRCPWCQNADLAHWPHHHDYASPPGYSLAPEELVAQAVITKSSIIAATYSEPSVFYEYALDVARLAREYGLLNVWVTNGSLSPDAIRELSPWLDAANIDLKAYSDKEHSSLIGFRPSWVMDTISLLKELGVWVEVTTLVVPGYNDSEEELRSIARFLVSLDKHIPWHISRYFPHYGYDRPATNIQLLEKARSIGMEEGLTFVYVGNVSAGPEVTRCHVCGKELVVRNGYKVISDGVTPDGCCASCGVSVPGVSMGEGIR